jgi:Excalibur calcium-binding domain
MLIGMRITIGVIAAAALASLCFAAPASAAPAKPAAHHYKNCTTMHHKYPHGVGRKGAKDHVANPKKDKPVTNFHVSTALYNANKGLDRDKDGIACEAH